MAGSNHRLKLKTVLIKQYTIKHNLLRNLMTLLGQNLQDGSDFQQLALTRPD